MGNGSAQGRLTHVYARAPGGLNIPGQLKRTSEYWCFFVGRSALTFFSFSSMLFQSASRAIVGTKHGRIGRAKRWRISEMNTTEIIIGALYVLSGGKQVGIETVREHGRDYGMQFLLPDGRATTLGLNPRSLRKYYYTRRWRRYFRHTRSGPRWSRHARTEFDHFLHGRRDVAALLANLRRSGRNK